MKSDSELRLWCLAAKGYTDLEINPVSAKHAWTEAETIAHQLGEVQWEARAKGELCNIGLSRCDGSGIHESEHGLVPAGERRECHFGFDLGNCILEGCNQ